MTAGLPGTGIGGLFYMLMVVLMPFRELVMVARGRSSWARWRVIGRSVGLLGAVIAALFGEWWVLKQIFEFFGVLSPGELLAKNGAGSAYNFVMPALAATPFIVLGGIYVTMHALRLSIRISAARKRLAATPALGGGLSDRQSMVSAAGRTLVGQSARVPVAE
jgi:hypothetical protein